MSALTSSNRYSGGRQGTSTSFGGNGSGTNGSRQGTLLSDRRAPAYPGIGYDASNFYRNSGSEGPTPTYSNHVERTSSRGPFGTYLDERKNLHYQKQQDARDIDNWNKLMAFNQQKDLAEYKRIMGYDAASGAIQQQMNLARQREGLNQQRFGIQSNEMISQFNNANKQNFADKQINSLDMGNAQRAEILQRDLMKIDKKRFSNTINFLSQQDVFNRRDLNLDGQQRDVGLAKNDNALKRLEVDNAARNRSQINNAAGRGMLIGDGNRNALDDLQTNFELNVNDLGQDRKSIGIAYDRAKLDFDKTGAGISKERTNAYLDRDEQSLNRKEQIRLAQNRQKTIFIQAYKLGLKGEEYRKQLEFGLKKLNIDKQLSANALADKLASSNAQIQSRAQDLEAQIFLMSKGLA